MPREEMVGENLREGIMEVALEQWTQRQMPSRLQRDSYVTGKRYEKVPAECRTSSSEFRW